MYDIHFQLLDPKIQARTGKYLGFGYKSAVGVQGPQKLINRWLMCLMTPKGSDPREPNFGTGFMTLIGSSISNVKDAVDLAALAVEDCNQQIREADAVRLSPSDERLESAAITRYEPHPSGAGFEIYVTIRNAAGAVMPIPLPAYVRR